MKINEFLFKKMLSAGEVGYWMTLKALVWAIYCAIFRPGTFEVDGETVENHAENGTILVFFGGFVMVLVGILMISAGLICTLLLLLLFLLSPLVSAVVCLLARHRFKQHMKAVEKLVREAADKAWKD